MPTPDSVGTRRGGDGEGAANDELLPLCGSASGDETLAVLAIVSLVAVTRACSAIVASPPVSIGLENDTTCSW